MDQPASKTAPAAARPAATAEPKPAAADPLSLMAVDANELRRRIANGEAGDLNSMIEAALEANDTRNAA